MFDRIENKSNCSGADKVYAMAQKLYGAATSDITDFPSLDDVVSCDSQRLRGFNGRFYYQAGSCPDHGTVDVNIQHVSLNIISGYEIVDDGGKIRIHWYEGNRISVDIEKPRLRTLQQLSKADLRQCHYAFEGNHYSPSCKPAIDPDKLFELFPVLDQIMAAP